jgi:propanol-preferring alcohol dehydrogenase
MKAMLLDRITDMDKDKEPLHLAEIPDPVPAEGEVLVKVSACGVCHTELDEIEGRTPPPRLPVVLGHQVVGRIVAVGRKVAGYSVGERVGIAWIYSTCGQCEFCLRGGENLCARFVATGRDVNGGYAEFITASAEFVHRLPALFSDLEAAPLLCAGAIGYRSLSLAGLKDGENLGLTGFGSSGHIVLKMVKYRYPRSKVFVFARSNEEKEFSRELGAVWAGDTLESSPEKLHAIIDTTPVWKTTVEALKNLEPGGRLIINAIRKEEVDKDYLMKLDYPSHLWMEKEIKSVANVSRRDVREFLNLAAEIPIKPDIEEYPLEDANRALHELKTQRIRGAKVLNIGSGE